MLQKYRNKSAISVKRFEYSDLEAQAAARAMCAQVAHFAAESHRP